MKIIIAVFFVISFLPAFTQFTGDASIIRQFHQIVKLIVSGEGQGLSKLVAYPLKRENPLPDISNWNVFTAYYTTLFDDSITKLLLQYHDSVIFEHNGSYGLVGGKFSGEIWVNEKGSIIAVNYSSDKEQALKRNLKDSIKRVIYPAINKWNDNILVAKSANLLFRIDRTDKGLRYVCRLESNMRLTEIK